MVTVEENKLIDWKDDTHTITEPISVNLNEVLKVGEYYCGENALAEKISNSPTTYAFKLIVENLLGTALEITDTTYCYFLQTIINYRGDIFVRGVRVGSDTSSITHDSWKQITTTTMEATAE